MLNSLTAVLRSYLLSALSQQQCELHRPSRYLATANLGPEMTGKSTSLRDRPFQAASREHRLRVPHEWGRQDYGVVEVWIFSFHNRLHSNALHRMRALVFCWLRFALSSGLTPRRDSHSYRKQSQIILLGPLVVKCACTTYSIVLNMDLPLLILCNPCKNSAIASRIGYL